MLYCPKGHQNPVGHRFCQTCGLELQPAETGEISRGTILGDRYLTVKQLGQGGFGRTYLAEDINRFNEQCVLKEFAPKLQGTSALKKAEELFTREAGVLYKFQHPQIPRFRELCRCQVGSKSSLFLVQDYVAGQTYRALLTHRQSQGYLFNEAEVLEMLRELLPLLDYIHSQGVIHRDISPDNLILRSSDRLPVLIDFGGVKQVAATIEQSQSMAGTGSKKPKPATRIGKLGYAPEEQMLLGVVHPHSDLYALAVTVLVLLTGKEPQALFDTHSMCWNWQQFVTLTPPLSIVLEKMLCRKQSDRFQSAKAVLQALGFSSSVNASPRPRPLRPTQSTNSPTELPPEFKPNPQLPPAQTSVSPTSVSQPPSNTVPPTVPPKPAKRKIGGLVGKVVLFLVVAIAAARGGWGLANHWLQSLNSQNDTNEEILLESGDSDSSNASENAEAKLKTELEDKRKALEINEKLFIRLVDRAFYTQYPEQQGRSLTGEAEDTIWRSRWYEVGLELLVKLETLSQPARKGMGKYRSSDFRQWQRDLEQQNSQKLTNLSDAQFYEWFPEQKDQNFYNQPIGQIWYAIAFDKFTALNRE